MLASTAPVPISYVTYGTYERYFSSFIQTLPTRHNCTKHSFYKAYSQFISVTSVLAALVSRFYSTTMPMNDNDLHGRHDNSFSRHARDLPSQPRLFQCSYLEFTMPTPCAAIGLRYATRETTFLVIHAPTIPCFPTHHSGYPYPMTRLQDLTFLLLPTVKEYAQQLF